jgi:aldehyde:ferredoxin oxidoreductase
MYGWIGKFLEIDLTTGEITQRDLATNLLRMYLGGRGLGVKVLSDRLDPGTDPFSPENILIFATGPFTGTRIPASGRHAVVTKSPLTGTIFDSNTGGFWGVSLKQAGYDCLIIKGKAAQPVWLKIWGHQVSLEKADSLWGRGTRETTALLAKYGRVACIGTAGENQVKFATIMNDYFHACGRGGLGAVMGSKNLKAITVQGAGIKPAVAETLLFQKYLDDITRLLVANPVSSKGLSNYGTAVLVNLINYMHLMPTANFCKVSFDKAAALSGEKIHETYQVKKTPCYRCPIACKRSTSEDLEIPEYETIALCGASCECDDLQAIMELNRLCNELGLDTITTGSTLACYAELEGVVLTPAQMIALVKQIARREGVGRFLGEGSYHYARLKGRPEVSMQVKGLELPGYDPRGALGLALSYATSNRGGCHLRAYMIGPEIFGKPKLIDRLSFNGKAGIVPVFQNFLAAVDSLPICKFTSFGVGEEELAHILTALTGEDYRTEDLMRMGERVWNLERLFNIQAGFTKKDDWLPERFFTDSEDGKGKALDRIAFEKCLAEYYRFRGWSLKGIPSTEKLKDLLKGREA